MFQISCHKRMSNLMVSNNLLFFLAKNTVFFLFSGKHHFNCLKQILLAYNLSAIFYCHNSSLINHIGKVRTSDLAKTVGYVFQNPNYQIFCASVRDEIKYGLKNLKLPENEIKTRTKEILAQFGLTSVAKTQPVSLSGGTKKVVALASVCAMDPSILLLDEPTTGQDQPGKQRLGQLMLSLSASGKTIIVISHDMNFVARYAQRVIVMAEGRVIGDDTPARIFSNESVMKQAHVQPPQVYAVVNELRREGQSIPEEAYTCSQAAGLVAAMKGAVPCRV